MVDNSCFQSSVSKPEVTGTISSRNFTGIRVDNPEYVLSLTFNYTITEYHHCH